MGHVPLQNPENTLSEDGAKLKGTLMDLFVLETPVEKTARKNNGRTEKIMSPTKQKDSSKIYIHSAYKKYYEQFIAAENDDELGSALGEMMWHRCGFILTHQEKLRTILMPYLHYLAGIDSKPQEEMDIVFGPVDGMISSQIITPKDKYLMLPFLPILAKTQGGGSAICRMVEGCFILGQTDKENLRGLLPDLAKTGGGTHSIALMVAEGFFGHEDKEMLWKLIPDILSKTRGAHAIASMIIDGIFTLAEIQNAFECNETQLKIILTNLKDEEEDDDD